MLCTASLGMITGCAYDCYVRRQELSECDADAILAQVLNSTQPYGMVISRPGSMMLLVRVRAAAFCM